MGCLEDEEEIHEFSFLSFPFITTSVQPAKPMRTNLSSCLGLFHNGQNHSTNRLLILVPHEGTHGTMRLIKQLRMFRPKIIKVRVTQRQCRSSSTAPAVQIVQKMHLRKCPSTAGLPSPCSTGRAFWNRSEQLAWSERRVDDQWHNEAKKLHYAPYVNSISTTGMRKKQIHLSRRMSLWPQSVKGL